MIISIKCHLLLVITAYHPPSYESACVVPAEPRLVTFTEQSLQHGTVLGNRWMIAVVLWLLWLTNDYG